MKPRPLVLMTAVSLTAALAGCTPNTMTAVTPVPVTAGSAASEPAPSSEPAVRATSACVALVEGMSTEERAGELVMAGVHGDLDPQEREAIASTGVGSVILMGTSTAGVAGTRERVDALVALAGPTGLMIAADQEGGQVQRLKGPGFAAIPPAVEQADLGDEGLTEAATAWAGQLAEAGVDLNLAPVADVVPDEIGSDNEPIGALQRGYGPTPGLVGDRVVAYIAGMHAGGVGTSVKHFPNLGRVQRNTDFAAELVDSETTPDDPALEPFRRAIEAGTETVMVGTAVYDQIDPDQPAAFSPAVVGLLRADLGFSGVVVSDDLGVAEAVAGVPPEDRAVRFVLAGGDLAISADVTVAATMVAGLVAAAEDDDALADRVRQSALRVVELKRALGVTSCGAASDG